MIVCGQRRLPAGLDHDGLMRLDDDGGAGNGVAGPELIAREYVGAVPAAIGEEAGAPRRRRQPGAGELLLALAKLRAAADRQQKLDRKSTRLNSSHLGISYAVFCLKNKIRLCPK